MLRRWGHSIGRLGRLELSPRFACELAKRRDGYAGEGSWQEFVYQGMIEVGAVPESRFPYTDQPGLLPISHVLHQARRFRITGYIDLLQDAQWAHLHPDLIKATLAGFLGGGPQAVSISLGITPSWGYRCAAEEGWIIFDEGAPVLGGHALTIIGYYFDETTQQTEFLHRNSWGVNWAPNNPLCPGCALVSERYLSSSSRTIMNGCLRSPQR
jgi:hypothetical protein